MKNICCFIGHREIYDSKILSNKLKTIIEKLITEENVEEFFVGNYGSFDRLAAISVRLLQKTYPKIKLTLVIPYLTAQISNSKNIYYKEYNNILIADIPENTPNRCKILKCNQYMVNSSQFLICYVKSSFGGAFETLEYAQKKKDVKIFNLAE